MIKIFDVPKRVNKNELTANIRRVSSGYKLSKKARVALGVSEDKSARLLMGGDGSNTVGIKAIHGETENYNATMSKSGVITTTGVVNELASMGERFEFTETVEDGFHHAKIVDTTDESQESTNNTRSVSFDDVSPRDTEISADADEDVTFHS